MIHKVGQIMLYVNNQDEAVQFWTEKVGFHLVADEDNDKLYEEFVEKEITVGELVNMPSGRAFNFADHEKNYFAIMEKK
ncbi:hypothetical protein COE80_15660 [Bacillus pseudomycoides]|uniref:VOC family protein n=1 Tax=Bacillus pseudomycoides TaxID=64104 RepID=UPI000BFD70E0|nr:VOC family protein [Bacillus pseudomycoides]PHB25650.1 hypothetical protein COE80_15660 [Bacillus pseudomycoides]